MFRHVEEIIKNYLGGRMTQWPPRFNPGEKVEVVSGELEGCKGKVVQPDYSCVIVEFSPEELAQMTEKQSKQLRKDNSIVLTRVQVKLLEPEMVPV